MQPKRLFAMYWSATGRTRKVILTIAAEVAKRTGLPLEQYDFTLPAKRESAPVFTSDDVVLFSTPTYAGRVPNLLLKYLDTVKGNGAFAVPVVTFGNRAFDNSLIELRDILHDNGFHPFAAGAFVGEHAFSTTLAAGRPLPDDLQKARAFAAQIADLLPALDANTPLIEVDGQSREERKYYVPRNHDGSAIDMRKVKPKTSEVCDNCGVCARVCPMGSIDFADVTQVPGICIKCCACVKKCHTGAKYFDDEAYLYHKHDLEEALKRPAEVALFVPALGA